MTEKNVATPKWLVCVVGAKRKTMNKQQQADIKECFVAGSANSPLLQFRQPLSDCQLSDSSKMAVTVMPTSMVGSPGTETE